MTDYEINKCLAGLLDFHTMGRHDSSVIIHTNISELRPNRFGSVEWNPVNDWHQVGWLIEKFMPRMEPDVVTRHWSVGCLDHQNDALHVAPATKNIKRAICLSVIHALSAHNP